MVGSSLRRVTMDDYDTEVQPGNQLAKASHIERGPIFTTASALHRFTVSPLARGYRLNCQILRVPDFHFPIQN